nr:hypothetical protein [Tanacetum cinerariifolium]
MVVDSIIQLAPSKNDEPKDTARLTIKVICGRNCDDYLWLAFHECWHTVRVDDDDAADDNNDHGDCDLTISKIPLMPAAFSGTMFATRNGKHECWHTVRVDDDDAADDNNDRCLLLSVALCLRPGMARKCA